MRALVLMTVKTRRLEDLAFSSRSFEGDLVAMEQFGHQWLLVPDHMHALVEPVMWDVIGFEIEVPEEMGENETDLMVSQAGFRLSVLISNSRIKGMLTSCRCSFCGLQRRAEERPFCLRRSVDRVLRYLQVANALG